MSSQVSYVPGSAYFTRKSGTYLQRREEVGDKSAKSRTSPWQACYAVNDKSTTSRVLSL